MVLYEIRRFYHQLYSTCQLMTDIFTVAIQDGDIQPGEDSVLWLDENIADKYDCYKVD